MKKTYGQKSNWLKNMVARRLEAKNGGGREVSCRNVLQLNGYETGKTPGVEKEIDLTGYKFARAVLCSWLISLAFIPAPHLLRSAGARIPTQPRSSAVRR